MSINSVNIDIGGTFTDCYVVYKDRAVSKKSPTTHYNLSVALLETLRQCADEFEISLEDLLDECDAVKYSTTIAMNSLIERKGPKLGLITTAGFEDTIIIGRGSQWHDGLPLEIKRNTSRGQRPEPLIPREMIVGVRERVDADGNIVVPLLEEEVLRAVQHLVNKGATGFVVSLIFSYQNPTHEQMIKRIIQQEYPSIYLGNMPVLLSSEVLPKKNEYERTMTTILTAYLHRNSAEQLNILAGDLRDSGYKRSLMLIHNMGGMAPLFRTTAVKTYNAGPVAGLAGGAYIARLYGAQNAIMTDMGGTSFDLGLLVNGQLGFYNFTPVVERWRVGFTMVESKSIGAGGGSIAWVNEALGNVLSVGPQSAGSMPGPVALDQGGEDPTVTDADVVLGYLDPEYYFGGRIPLNKDKAWRAIEEKIARPLGIGVEEAALGIKKLIDANMGNEIFKETHLRGHDPRDFVLLAYGGAGPTHCCGYHQYIQTPKIITLPFSPVFSAFGVSILDFVFVYEQTSLVQVSSPVAGLLQDVTQYNETVAGLQAQAIRDITSEGFSQEAIVFNLELEMRYGLQPNLTRVKSPRLFLNGEADVRAVLQSFEQEYRRQFTAASAYPQGGVEIINFILQSTVVSTKLELPTFPLESSDPSQAQKGQREVYWEELDGFSPTRVYQREHLQPGNMVEGPAIIEAVDTTYVIPPKRIFTVDKYGNGIIENI